MVFLEIKTASSTMTHQVVMRCGSAEDAARAKALLHMQTLPVCECHVPGTIEHIIDLTPPAAPFGIMTLVSDVAYIHVAC